FAATAENRARLAIQQQPAENGYDARLPMGCLARAEDIRIPQHDVGKLVEAVVQEEVVLHGVLADAILADGIDRVAFVDWQILLWGIPVDGAARGDVNE